MPSVAAYRILAEHESCRRSLPAAQTFLRKPAGETGFFLETLGSHSRVRPALPAKPDRTDRDDKRPCPTEKCTSRNGARLPWSDPLYNLFARHRLRKIFVSDRPHRRVRRKPHRKERFFPVCAELLPQPRPPNRFSKRTANDPSPDVSSTWKTSLPKSNLLRWGSGVSRPSPLFLIYNDNHHTRKEKSGKGNPIERRDSVRPEDEAILRQRPMGRANALFNHENRAMLCKGSHTKKTTRRPDRDDSSKTSKG